MVSANERIVAEPDINRLQSHSDSDSNSMTTSAVSAVSAVNDESRDTNESQIEINSNDLLEYLHQSCALEPQTRQLCVGSGSTRTLSLGTVRLSTQRRSVTKDMAVVANGLKPVRGSVNRFAVNQIDDRTDETIGSNDTLIEFINRPELCAESGSQSASQSDDYPICSEANVIATSRDSQLFIKDSNQLIAIRSKDGFVLIHSNLRIVNKICLGSMSSSSSTSSGNRNQLKHFYSSEEKANLFVVGIGEHLLVVDKINRNESVLVVGAGGLQLVSLFNKSYPNHNCSHSCVSPAIHLSGSSLSLPVVNGLEVTNKRHSTHSTQPEKTSKKQKSNHWSSGSTELEVELVSI